MTTTGSAADTRLPEVYPAVFNPIRAAVIVTGSSGITAGEASIDVGDRRIPAYCAKPASGASFPIVIVVQEIFGVHLHIQDLCRRLAKVGYLGVAPALFDREGDTTGMTDIPEIQRKVVSRVPDAQVLSDLDRTVAWAENEGGDPSKLAITGFCWGGRIVWLYSAHSSKLKAGAAWYGKLTAPKDPLHPRTAIEAVPDLKAPVLGLYGGKDAGIPLDHVEMMRDALRAAGRDDEIVVYPEAEHGFNADYRASYNEASAKDGWRRMLKFFHEKGIR